MVSVALCTYNGERYIEEQLRSILNQTERPDEIIVGDDGSTDATVQIVERILAFAGIPYKVLVHEKTLGVTGNFEKTISACTGDIIFTCDQDDVWHPEKIKRMMKEFDGKDDVCFVFTNAELVDANLNSLNSDLWSTLSFDIQQLKRENAYDIILKRCIVTGATMAFRKELFNRCFPIPEEWLHDGWLSINAITYGGIIAVDEKLIFYRQHGNNVVGARKRTLLGVFSHYCDGFSLMHEERIKRYERYKRFFDFAYKKLSEADRRKVERCIEFWSGAVKLNTSNLGEGTKWIIFNIYNRNYEKYYTGFRGALRDWLLLLRKGK